MPTFLTLLTIALIATLFSGSVPEPFLPQFKIATLVAPLLLLLVQVVRSTSAAAKTQPAAPVIAKPEPESVAAPAAARSVTPEQGNDRAVIDFLARLQEKGRLIDFIMDDITAYDNESVGAAARIVHQGCHEVLKECFTIEAVFDGEEMETVQLGDHYDSHKYRLIGKVPDSAPYEGQVLHRGWKTSRINLPRKIQPASAPQPSTDTILAPVEIEISA